VSCAFCVLCVCCACVLQSLISYDDCAVTLISCLLKASSNQVISSLLFSPFFSFLLPSLLFLLFSSPHLFSSLLSSCLVFSILNSIHTMISFLVRLQVIIITVIIVIVLSLLLSIRYHCHHCYCCIVPMSSVNSYDCLI
jgi:hypothetical protein